MRFRAKTTNESLIIISGVISQLQRSCLGSKAAVYLTPDHVRLTVLSDETDSPKCYSELVVDSLFTEYITESKASNAILFEIGLDNWARALQSGKHAVQCIFKLTKQDDRPYLSFESRSLDAMTMNVTHDIPIRIIPAEEITNYLPPDVPSPDVALELPRSKLLRPTVEKMGKYSKHILLTCHQRGNLTLGVKHSSAVITTHYTGLTPRYEGTMTLENSRGNVASLKVDKKKLSNVLNYGNLPRSGVFLFANDNSTLVVHIALSPSDAGSLTYFVPVIIMEDQEGS